MITELGIVAGEIWHVLEKKKTTTVMDVFDSLNKPKETVLMSIGWLAREGHILLEGNSPDYTISLRKTEKK